MKPDNISDLERKAIKMKKILVTITLAVFIVISALPISASAENYETILNETLGTILTDTPNPKYGSEWYILSLARGGYSVPDGYYEEYYNDVAENVASTAEAVDLNGALNKNRSTDNSRVILALAAIGKKCSDVGGVNLAGAYAANGITWVAKQGVNGAAYALLALDACGYESADIKNQCVNYILAAMENGGWGYSFGGSFTLDVDLTAMVLQSLAPYTSDSRVAAAVDEAFDTLSNLQQADGGYVSWGAKNCESIAQVVVACALHGIDPATDVRFVKDSSALDAMLEFYHESDRAFSHTLTGSKNGMATYQAAYALVAYSRFKNNQKSLYDMASSQRVVCDECQPDGVYLYNRKKHWQCCSVCNSIVGEEAHTGGRADCQSKAICAVCGEEYGEIGQHVYKEIVGDDSYIRSICVICQKENKFFTPVKADFKLPEFIDFNADHWAYSSVKELCEKGIVKYEKNEFLPNTPADVQDIVAAVLRNEPQSPDEFLAENKITVNETDGKITRENLIALFYEIAKVKGVKAVETNDISMYSDADKVSDCCAEAIAWASECGLVNGKGNGELSPDTATTNSEAAVMLLRFEKLFK